MIRLSEIVPSVYTDASRDFQYISRLIDIVLNSVKHNVDNMYDLPNNKSDPKLTELLATTLGFKIRRNYDKAQLAILAGLLPIILKYKGSVKAIELVGQALLLATDTASNALFECKVDNNCLVVVLSNTLTDTTLFMDLLPYILPAGISCRVSRVPLSRAPDLPAIEAKYSDKLYAAVPLVLNWDESTNNSSGLATMYSGGPDTPAIVSTSANIIYPGSDDQLVNTGLLSNSIIPDITGPINTPEKDEDN